MIRVLIADDHTIFRKGLRQTIEDNDGLTVVCEATDGFGVLSGIREHSCDAVILDISMPGPGIFDVLKQIKSEHPRMPILVLSMHPEEQYALRLFKSGAAGYLTKDTDEEEIVAAIRKISSGGKYVTSSLAEQLACAVDSDFEDLPHLSLSDREYEVMLLLARGDSISDIAARLNLGVTTVSTYRSRILEKTGLKNNVEIARYAVKNELID